MAEDAATASATGYADSSEHRRSKYSWIKGKSQLDEVTHQVQMVKKGGAKASPFTCKFN